MAKKKFDAQAKAKRQKIIAAVGGVILLGVLAFQVPRTLKLLHQSNASATSEPAATTPAIGATGTVAPPTLGGASGTLTASGASADGITDPSELTSVGSGQLLAFSRFRTKDPFAQQINTNCATSGGGSNDQSACPSSGGTGTTAAKPKTEGTVGTGTTKTQPQPPAPAPVAATKPTSARISVNNVTETVAVGAKFPASSPTFVLVSLTKNAAKISIAGGSLAGGAPAVTVKKGATLTLMNTADGTRYVLRLVSVA